VSHATQSVVFNAVPLLVLAAAYLIVTGSLVPTLWRQRGRTNPMDVAGVLIFPALAVMAAIWAGVVIYDRSPIGGHVWPGFVGIVVGLLPAALILLRWRERRGLLASGPMLAQRDRELDATSGLSHALARTQDARAVARAFLDTVARLFEAGFAGLSLVSEDGVRAWGFLARRNGEDWPWWGRSSSTSSTSPPASRAPCSRARRWPSSTWRGRPASASGSSGPSARRARSSFRSSHANA
jgi:hypothetical protein